MNAPLEKNLFFNDAIILNYKMSQNAELLQFLLKPNKKNSKNRVRHELLKLNEYAEV